MKRFLFLFAVFCALLMPFGPAMGEDNASCNENTTAAVGDIGDIYDEGDFHSLVNSGNNAYAIGFFELAKKFFLQALELGNISNEQKQTSAIGFIDSCLSAGNFSELADKFKDLIRLPSGDSPLEVRQRFLLRLALVACLQNEFSLSGKTIAKIDIKALNDNEMAWYYVVKSIAKMRSASVEEALSLFEEAKKYAISSEDAAQLQAFFIQFLLQLPNGPSEVNALLFELDLLCKKYKFQRAGYPFVRAYMLLLCKIGAIEQASALADTQISNIVASNIQDVQSFRLYKAIVNGLQSPMERATITDILLSTANDELKKQALKALVASAKTVQQKYDALESLSESNLQTLPPVTLRQILFAKAKLAVETGNIETAQQVASEIALRFPNEALLANIYNALAYLAWKQDPRDYRMAAHYLKAVCDISESPTEKFLINNKIGNAFYLSGAYDIAAGIYKEILQTNSLDVPYDKILYQLVQSDIKMEDFSSAQKDLLNFRNTHNLLTEYRWIAELTYVHALIGSLQYDRAEEYLSDFMGVYANTIPPFFSIKFRLLQSQLMLLRHNYQRAQVLAGQICAMFPEEVSAVDIAKIIAQALFVKGACEFKSKNSDDGRATFLQLRSRYPAHEAAMLSYFEEAEFYFNQGDAERAKNLLLQLAEQGCRYSPLAYYKMAEYHNLADIGGQEAAIACLSTLVSKFKNHELAYAARLKIADLLRSSGRFSDAESVYEELLKDFPFDSRHHFVEFCLAKAIFAQKNKGGLFGERAKIILERLNSVATLDKSLRLEVAAMYCFVLRSNGLLDEMKKVAWEAILKNIAEARQFSKNDSHWMWQVMYMLDKCYADDPSGAEAEALRQIKKKFSDALSK